MNETDHFILDVIDRIAGPDGRNGYPTAAEICDRLGYAASTVGAHLRALEASGHVVKMGSTFSGARTWAPTDAGRAALRGENAR